jgi:ectoine hydroxylase-related dioxygenase (phytanoyl-CoA dioxygenase family)
MCTAAIMHGIHMFCMHTSCTLPTTQAQQWHRDDGVLDSRLASVQIAISPTRAEQGALEVLPASHTHDERPAAAGVPDLPGALSIAVPQGSVVFYSPNLVHRGRANSLDEERLAVTMNVMGARGLVPDGIPLAVHPADAGRWWLMDGALVAGERAGSAPLRYLQD